ncbi:hypothetical protein [Amaricoccus sp.]|uniref:hypothetical protein n=1 Tax=Amaricoccus sp. TaxID=1872485 RepID=UPI0025BADD84|nr:hypothetical protein [Amaricoccus sp.]
MATKYPGLVASLMMPLIVFFREAAFYIPQELVLSSDDAILAVITHLTFVVSGVLLASMDFLAARSGKH